MFTLVTFSSTQDYLYIGHCTLNPRRSTLRTNSKYEGGRLRGWKWLQDPAGGDCQILDEKSEALRTIRARCCVCACLCAYIFASLHWSFRGSEQLTFFSFNWKFGKSSQHFSFGKYTGSRRIYVKFDIWESSFLRSNMSNYQWELSTLSHAFRFLSGFSWWVDFPGILSVYGTGIPSIFLKCSSPVLTHAGGNVITEM